jgi:hypothetical protein
MKSATPSLKDSVPPQTVPLTKPLVRALGHSGMSYRGPIAMPRGVHDGLKPSASGLYTPYSQRVAPSCWDTTEPGVFWSLKR